MTSNHNDYRTQPTNDTKRKIKQTAMDSLSRDSIFSIIFYSLFKGIQSSTVYYDLISYMYDP